MNSVTPGSRADGNYRVAHALSLRTNQVALVHQAHTHCVDEWIAFIRGIENDLAGNGRYPNAVAVVADAFDHSRKEIAGPGTIQGPEPQRIQHRNGTRAHSEDITKNSADARGCALIRLDGGRMIV